jgi:hypothetical protein
MLLNLGLWNKFFNPPTMKYSIAQTEIVKIAHFVNRRKFSLLVFENNRKIIKFIDIEIMIETINNVPDMLKSNSLWLFTIEAPTVIILCHK